MQWISRPPRHTLLLLFVLLSALSLRLSVLYAPIFHWPQGADHFIYFEMANNASQGRGGVIDFIYSYLASPEQITHLEDYYEPFYGWLCGIFILSSSYISSLTLPFLSNFLQLILLYVLTLKIATEIFKQTYKSAKTAGLLAVTLLALHPLFIERSTWIMKESVIGLTYLILALTVLKYWKHKHSALYLSGLSFFIGALQYESWPILGVSFFLLYARYRRWASLLIFTGSSILRLYLVIPFGFFSKPVYG